MHANICFINFFFSIVAEKLFFIMYTPKKTHLSNSYLIGITDDALKFCKVKEVMEIIVDLLKDRVEVLLADKEYIK